MWSCGRGVQTLVVLSNRIARSEGARKGPLQEGRSQKLYPLRVPAPVRIGTVPQQKRGIPE
eukprot:6625-Eustigmatos_ZCMA.PRE.1